MKRIIEYGLILLVSLLLLVSGLVLVIVNLDSNTFKPVIQYWVKETTQRSFIIAGDLQIAFYPQIEIRCEDMMLSEFKKDEQFASIEHARLSLSLWPLLRKQVVVDTVQIKGLNARLIRYQDGRMNIDDLLEEDAQPLTFSLDIGQAEIAMSRLVFQDEKTQQTLALNNMYLTIDRITAESIGQIDYSSQLIKKAGVNVDIDAQTYQMELDSHFDIEFDARNMLFNDREFLSGPITASMQGSDSGSHLNVNVSISDIQQSNGHLSSKHLHAELKSKQNEHAVEVVLDTSLAARLDDQQWTFRDLETNVTFSRSKNGGTIYSHFSGHIDMDILSELLQLELQGMLADSHLEAVVHLQGFSEQNLQFKIQSNRLDLDPLLSLQRSETQTKTEKEIIQQAANNSFPLPDLLMSEHLNLNGEIYIEQLLAGDIRASGIQLSIEPEQNHFDLNKPVH